MEWTTVDKGLARATLTAIGSVCVLLLVACSSPAASQPQAQQPAPPSQVTASYKDISYEVDGQAVRLVNGAYETEAAPGSASKVITKYFGNDVTGDLNGDGVPDIAFLLTRSGGGSGTFYYVVVALKTAGGYTGTNAVLLGDRIAPQTTLIAGGELVVNYADRKAGEPMTTTPSVGVSKYMTLVSGKLQISR